MKITTSQQAQSLLSSIDTIMFDCDGVLWAGAKAIPGSGWALRELEKMGKKIFYVSNNSTKCREEYVSKIQKCLGVESNVKQMFSSAVATAEYVKQKGAKKCFVLGQPGLKTELERAGCTIIADPPTRPYNPDAIAGQSLPTVDAVVIGHDFNMTMEKLALAILYLSSENPPLFVLTNPDAVIPINGKSMPEAACIAAAISANIRREPDAVCGKPDPLLYNIMGSPPRTLMVGDRLETDIQFGSNAGVKTLLVLSGYQNESDLIKSDLQPDFYATDIGEVVRLALGSSSKL